MKPELDKAVEAMLQSRVETIHKYPIVKGENEAEVLALHMRDALEAAAPILLAPYQERIKELEAEVRHYEGVVRDLMDAGYEADKRADRLAEAVDNTLGLWPGGDEEAHALDAALSEYRDETEGE